MLEEKLSQAHSLAQYERDQAAKWKAEAANANIKLYNIIQH